MLGVLGRGPRAPFRLGGAPLGRLLRGLRAVGLLRRRLGVAARDARSHVAVFAFSSFVRNSRSRVSSFVLVSSLAFCSSALVAKRSKRVSTVSALSLIHI